MRAAINALKAWALAEVLMAAVYVGQWRSLRLEPDGAPAPAAEPLVTALELVYLVPFLAAIALVWRWWRIARPRIDVMSGLSMLLYGVASAASFALWAEAGWVEDVRRLYALDAGISLMGLWPALSLVALIRRTAAWP